MSHVFFKRPPRSLQLPQNLHVNVLEPFFQFWETDFLSLKDSEEKNRNSSLEDGVTHLMSVFFL